MEIFNYLKKRDKIDIFIKMTGRPGNMKKTVLSRSKRYVWSAYDTTTMTIKRPSVQLLCQWVKAMATDLSRSESQDLKSVVYPMK
jgi:hypothetical protein